MGKAKHRSNTTSSGAAQADADHHDSQPVSKKARIDPPSSSTVSVHTNNILTAAKAVDTQDVDADVDPLIDYIIHLLEHIEEKKTVNNSSKTEGAKDSRQISSESLKRFREVLSEAINVFKDIIPGEAKSVIQGLLKGMGVAHLTSCGFLFAAHVLERFETVSTNRDNCLRVLDEICHLAQHVKKLRRSDGLRKEMEGSMKEAMGLIVEASIMCSTLLGSSKGWRYFKATQTKEKLEHVEQSLQRMYRHMNSEVTICIYEAMMQLRPHKPRDPGNTNTGGKFQNAITCIWSRLRF